MVCQEQGSGTKIRSSSSTPMADHGDRICSQCKQLLEDRNLAGGGDDVDGNEEAVVVINQLLKRQDDLRVYMAMVIIVAVAAVVTLVKIICQET